MLAARRRWRCGSNSARPHPHRTEIQAERMVLTHMSTDMLSRLADGELPAAYDGMVIDL